MKIGCLLLSDNFYYYLLTSLLFTVLRNLMISHVVNKRFPQYVCRGSINEGQFAELKLLVGGLALSKFRGASRHAIDSICFTAFVSLTMTAIYSNYFLIHSAVISISGIICNAMVASVGNSIAMESREKNYRDMRRFNFMYMLLAGWAMGCLLCFYQSFVRIWVGPKLMLGLPEVVVLCLYFYVLKMGDMRWIYHQGAGLWWKARNIVVAEIVCNVVLNILLAKYWGVLGIILATLISLFFINFLGGAWILFKEYYQNGKLQEFFADQALYFGVTVILAVMCFWGCEWVSSWLNGVSTFMTMPAFAVDAVAADSGHTKFAVDAVAANSGHTKLFELVGLVVRLLLCTLVTVAGYYVAYHHTARYQDAKEWVKSRFSVMKIGKRL